MAVQDWHAHAERVATPAQTISGSDTPAAPVSPGVTGHQNDLAADLAALTRVLLNVGDHAHVTTVQAAVRADAPAPSVFLEPDLAPTFVAPALVEVTPLVEAAAPTAAPVEPVAEPAPPSGPTHRVSASDLIGELGFLDA